MTVCSSQWPSAFTKALCVFTMTMCPDNDTVEFDNDFVWSLQWHCVSFTVPCATIITPCDPHNVFIYHQNDPTLYTITVTCMTFTVTQSVSVCTHSCHHNYSICVYSHYVCLHNDCKPCTMNASPHNEFVWFHNDHVASNNDSTWPLQWICMCPSKWLMCHQRLCDLHHDFVWSLLALWYLHNDLCATIMV